MEQFSCSVNANDFKKLYVSSISRAVMNLNVTWKLKYLKMSCGRPATRRKEANYPVRLIFLLSYN